MPLAARKGGEPITGIRGRLRGGVGSGMLRCACTRPALFLAACVAAPCRRARRCSPGWSWPARRRRPPAEHGYRVVQSFPHDPEAFTQGLLFHEGRLFESTGGYGASTLREVDLETGRVLRERRLGGRAVRGGLGPRRRPLRPTHLAGGRRAAVRRRHPTNGGRLRLPRRGLGTRERRRTRGHERRHGHVAFPRPGNARRDLPEGT